jgi:hypothetical protein
LVAKVARAAREDLITRGQSVELLGVMAKICQVHFYPSLLPLFPICLCTPLFCSPLSRCCLSLTFSLRPQHFKVSAWAEVGVGEFYKIEELQVTHANAHKNMSKKTLKTPLKQH